ncbi:endonuclease/exonuclease/phosphatase family protein [Szabonella alba]|uniref:Endonuclease n=1 Tax=Szabonella alba TaxID=2804194 RepID=A0A8K0VE15_9RHOB|nr:endonuclease/exonuclease/phosphatase family protein [Szabonella alba]MBL4917395.1 endonuclease [Szabonella alba]
MASKRPEAGAKAPPRLRIATYNVEWFNALFDDDGLMLPDSQRSARHGISRGEQLGALGIVFTALDADGILIVEAPDQSRKRSTTRALDGFARHFGLRARRALIGFQSDTEQEIAFLFDPDRIGVRHDPQGTDPLHADPSDIPRFDGVFRHDLNADAQPERISFSKPPLELALQAGGRAIRLIGVHAKSKAPHGARSPDEAMRIGIENRRKQLAQCLWLRQRARRHLESGDSLIVLGDFNDGPGLDEYEKLFGQSGVEIVMGLHEDPGLRLREPHAELALQSRIGLSASTARFWLDREKRYFEALLDFILVSADLAATGPRWRIWHPLNDPDCWQNPDLREALLTASDHFPVSIDL